MDGVYYQLKVKRFLKYLTHWAACCLLLVGVFFISAWAVAATPTITATISITVCGNGTIDTGEDCDGAALGSATCQSQDFGGGTLLCSAACTFNTALCSTTAPQASST